MGDGCGWCAVGRPFVVHLALQRALTAREREAHWLEEARQRRSDIGQRLAVAEADRWGRVAEREEVGACAGVGVEG